MASRRIASLLAALFLVLTSSVIAQELALFQGPPLDASAPPQGSDATDVGCPPAAILFTQNTGQTITPGNSVGCVAQPPSPQYHGDNSWWRTFLPQQQFGVLGPVQVCEVQVGVELAQTPGAVGQTVDVRIGVTLDGIFPAGYRLVLGEASVIVPDMANSFFTVPMSVQIPSGSEVFVEIHVPDARSAQHIFFPAGNSQPENSPTWLSSANCQIPIPVTMASLGAPQIHTLINFRGVEVPIAPNALQFDSDPNYVVDVGDTTSMATTWTSFFPGPTPVSSTFTPVYASGTLSASMPDNTANYGTKATGVPTSCTSTADCSTLSVNGVKTPGAHEDVYIREGTLADKIWDIHVAPTFLDVAPGNPFYRYIETIVHHGITAGCAAGNYCPGQTTIRQQMAAFVLKAKEGIYYAPPACGTPMFTDVPASNPFCPFIEELARRGVVAGCGGGNYCPANPVTREQMAVFVLKTLDPAMNPPACAPPNTFNDVAEGSPFCRWIEELASRGVVTGCGNGAYCPTNPVNRQQMGVFLSGTFGLTLYGP